jgi:hypothetical protein
MSFCPFMSNADKKIECSSECAMYVQKSDKWEYPNGEFMSGCGIKKSAYAMVDIGACRTRLNGKHNTLKVIDAFRLS